MVGVCWFRWSFLPHPVCSSPLHPHHCLTWSSSRAVAVPPLAEVLAECWWIAMCSTDSHFMTAEMTSVGITGSVKQHNSALDWPVIAVNQKTEQTWLLSLCSSIASSIAWAIFSRSLSCSACHSLFSSIWSFSMFSLSAFTAASMAACRFSFSICKQKWNQQALLSSSRISVQERHLTLLCQEQWPALALLKMQREMGPRLAESAADSRPGGHFPKARYERVKFSFSHLTLYRLKAMFVLWAIYSF